MPFTRPLAKTVCPFCFERFHLSRAPLRLIGRGAPQEPDTAVGCHFDIPAPQMGKVVEPPPAKSVWRKLWRRCHLPREAADRRRICPTCHIYLPDKMAAGEVGNEVLAIVGARNSGKSNYFGVLLKYLKQRCSAEVGFDLMDVTTFGPGGPISTADLYQERYGKDLYDPDKPRAVGQTHSVTTTVGTRMDPRIPLIYLIRFPKRPWHHVTRPLAGRVPVYLMIFDAAGEDMGSRDVMEQYYRFLGAATGLVFLIDPFEYPGIRSRLPADVRAQVKPTAADPGMVVDRVVEVYQQLGRVRADRQIPVPAAFVLTKADLLGKIPDLVYDHSPIGKESHHDRGYDLAGGAELSREVKECVRRWDSSELVVKAETNFREHRFFATSALGTQPDAKTLALDHPPSPRRVADPLLWLFYRRGYIPAARRP